MYNNYFLMYDFEATGKDPTKESIISMGAVLTTYKDKKFTKVDEFHTFVSTRRKIEEGAIQVHHITKKDLIGAPTFCEAIDIFKLWISSHLTSSNDRLIFVAHNGSKYDDIIIFCDLEKMDI